MGTVRGVPDDPPLSVLIAGFSNVRCQLSHQSCNWSLPWTSVWGQLSGGPRYSNSSARHLFHPCGCARVVA